MRKIIGILGIVFLVGLLFAPFVSAGIIAGNPDYNYDGTEVTLMPWLDYPSSDGYNCAYGESFTANETEISGVLVYLHRYTTFDANLSVRVWGVTGSTVENCLPNTGDLIGESEVLSHDSFPTGLDWVFFNFSTPLTVVSGTNYTWALVTVEHSGTAYLSQDYIHIAADHDFSVSARTDGAVIHYHNSAWGIDSGAATYNTTKLIYYVVGSGDLPEATPTPTAAPSGSGDGDATLEYWGGIISEWIFPMLLVLVPAFLGLKFLGQMGFVVGLNIGVIIGYAAIPDVIGLWTVILIAVADIMFIMMTRR